MNIIVQFGAGNVGRGHIGHIFSKAGYKVVFADIDEQLISLLREKGYYIVRLIGESIREEKVENFEVYHIDRDREKILEYISRANIVSTAVGPNIYLSLAPIIAEGLALHKAEPVNVMACENFFRSTERLRLEISKYLSPLPEWIGFPNVEIGRIIPPTERGSLLVNVEDYNEFLIEKSTFVGSLPNIEGLEFVDRFELFWKRKIYTVNMGHAVLGYLGYLKGYTNVSDAIQDNWIREILVGALYEVKVLLTKLGLDLAYIDSYIEVLLKRFSNRELGDTVYRVARDPIRKLKPEDRLVGPALECEKNGLPFDNLAFGIAGALLFDYKEDKDALELQEKIKEEGLESVLQNICNIPLESYLAFKVRESYRILEEIKKNENSRL
ncbi:MAG: mannitol-1-phosphate 5-dehydrogenase [bacterium]|nr:mannitol-1-phosphate 5-dehydrogenase [bacterium]